MTGKLSLDPPRLLDEMAVYRTTGWTPHPGQAEIIRNQARNRVVAAGRRFGKSDLGGHRLFVEALNTRLVASSLNEMKRRREFWVVGPSYVDSEKEFRVLWNEIDRAGLKEYLDRPGSYNNPLQGDLHVSMWDGAFQVHAKSEKHPDSLVGEGLSGVVLAEAAKLKESTWTKLLRPTLADYGGWALATSTPEGKNWFYDLWRRGNDPSRSDWASFRMPSWVNPHVYPLGASDDAITLLRRAVAARDEVTPQLFTRLGIDLEIAALVLDLTEEAFNQEIGALFTNFVGRVFKEFDEEKHVVDLEFNPGWQTYAAVDYGFTNPSVWLLVQVDPFGEQVNVLDEVYETGLNPSDFADEIKRRGLAPAGLQCFYPDPASPGDTRILEQRLRVRARGGTGGTINHRINLIRAALRDRHPHLAPGNPERIPALRFDRKCERTIADMLNYRYPERKLDTGTNAPENPLKKDDHGPEALGRFFAGFYGSSGRRGRVSRSTLGH